MDLDLKGEHRPANELVLCGFFGMVLHECGFVYIRYQREREPEYRI